MTLEENSLESGAGGQSFISGIPPVLKEVHPEIKTIKKKTSNA